jgi:hypothetical protein
MAILDNITAAPTYGVRYTLEYTNRTNNKVKLDIYERGYEGVADDIIGTDEPFIVSQSFADGDFFRPIAGTQIDLSLWAATTDQFVEFRYADDRKYFATVLKDNKIMAFGYLMPETYEQDWGSLHDVVRITATCGLGLLKDIPFANNLDPLLPSWETPEPILGIERLSDIITFFVYKVFNADIGLTFNWFDGITIRPEDASEPTYGCLYNTFVECDRWEGMNCEQVLTEILESFNAQIVQYCSESSLRGYMVRHMDGQAFDANVFTLAGVRGYSVNIDQEYIIPTDGRYAGRLMMKIEKPVEKIIIRYPQIERVIMPGADDFSFDGAAGDWFILNDSYRTVFVRQGAPGVFLRADLTIHGLDFPESYIEVEFECAHQMVLFTNPDADNDVNIFIWTVQGATVGDAALEATQGYNKWQRFNKVFRIPATNPVVRVVFNPLIYDPGRAYDVNLMIRNVKARLVDNSAGGKVPGDYYDSIYINPNSTQTLTIDRMYDYPVNPALVYPNVLFYLSQNKYLLDDPLSVFFDWRNLQTSTVETLNDFIKAKYENYYSLNKARYSGGIWDNGSTARLFPVSVIQDPEIDQLLKITACTWQPKNNYYEFEMVGFRQTEAPEYITESVLDAVLDFNLHF